MTPIQLIDYIINLICDWQFRIVASLFVGVVCALFGLLRSARTGGIVGLVGMVLAFGILELGNYLLNIPLGPPPLALPTDYTGFWLQVAIGVIVALVVVMSPAYILLYLIYRKLPRTPCPARHS